MRFDSRLTKFEAMLRVDLAHQRRADELAKAGKSKNDLRDLQQRVSALLAKMASGEHKWPTGEELLADTGWYVRALERAGIPIPPYIESTEGGNCG
jgi:hypothetical protein